MTSMIQPPTEQRGVTVDERVIWFESLGMDDVARVGGKNASLGEMIRGLTAAGVRVPDGFATTSAAFREFLRHGHLAERINARVSKLDIDDVEELARAGAEIRQWIIDTPFPDSLNAAITAAWRKMEEKAGGEVAVAVRSSATAEDLPDASFAGQQETYLNVRGLDNVLTAIHHVFASLYNDRAIAYRVHHNFEHHEVALSAGIQRMARSDIGAAGVMFTLDTESGFRDAVFITGAYGLGETVVQGAVNPDEFYVYKPALAAGKHAILSRKLGSKAIKMIYGDSSAHGKTTKTVDVAEAERQRFCLTDEQLLDLARQAVIIEKHYGRPMDIEWALDGTDNKVYIVQARPETVKSRANGQMIERYRLKEKGAVLAQGRAIGQRIGAGPARIIMDISQMSSVKPGDVLVTDMTDPDWEPIMKIASAIVTNRGGRTCHAAIISRELGIPCVIGTGTGTEKIKKGQDITVSSAEGETGYVYEGLLKFEIERIDLGDLPKTKTKIMMNLAIPEKAFSECQIPNDGVGLAREEFVINSHIGIHPLALYNYEELKKSADPEKQAVIRAIDEKTAAYTDKKQFFIDKVAEGVGRIAAGFYPKDVIVRLSDFKSNEYANLVGGTFYEPDEENPMIGWRGASRYYDPKYRPAFELECKGLLKARNDMGLTNIKLMVPFCRTPEEGRKVVEVLRDCGLIQGENGLELYVMCEIPSNVILADAFADIFDGFSIGSNDLTQLTYGLDRDSGLLSGIADERHAAVKEMIKMVIATAKRRGRKIGICGQGPSDFPDFATFLVECGIDSMSLIPDTAVKTRLAVAAKEKEMGISA